MKTMFYALLLTTALALPTAMAQAQGELNVDQTASSGMDVTTSVADRTLMRGEILDTTTLTELQRALMARGYNPGRVDGIWGPRTADALRRFHMDNGAATMKNGHLNSNTLTQLGIHTDMSARMHEPLAPDATGATKVEPSAGANNPPTDNGISGSDAFDYDYDSGFDMEMDDSGMGPNRPAPGVPGSGNP
jgi:peptidoglycan hydrolase-like protein with peptidoglycan-binding domain